MDRRLADLLAGSAVRAAPALIGWRIQAGPVGGIIAETEAYASQRDRACHACRGRTPRTETLYAKPGTLYVYLCYGMHWMLNVVCQPAGMPAAVLIRGLIPDDGEPRQTNGPGKAARMLGLDGSHNGRHLSADDCPIVLTPPTGRRLRLRRGPRVGVDYAGPDWSQRPWRWWIDGYPAVGVARAAGG